MSNPIIRAIDAGSGVIKFVKSHEPGKEIVCSSFPALTAAEATNNLRMSLSAARRDTVVVDIDGTRYEVGPDINLALSSTYSRPLHEDYTGTKAYIALNLAALAYMGEKVIDVLAVGLPVSLVDRKSKYLSHLLSGVHQINETTDVIVREVLVFAQPLGGFLSHLYTQGRLSLDNKKNTLIIDPGYHTLDWLVTRGIKPVESRSDDYPGGMSKVYQAMAKQISNDLGRNFNNLELIDEGLRNKGKTTLYGQDINMNDYLKYGVFYIDEAINAMRSSVGDAGDINEIVLVGGGADAFKPAVERCYTGLPLSVSTNSSYDNVKGFQIAAESLIKARNKAECAA